jgi:hypothetical protein
VGGKGAVRDPDFGIRIVSAYAPGTTAYLDTTGAVLNNNSGNIRLDNVTISGVVPEPASLTLGVIGLGAVGLLACRQRRQSA